MELEAVNKARALAIIGIDELNLGGKIRFADCVKPLIERYGFLVYPSEVKDFDFDKGVRFESGKADGLVIDALVIYGGALYIDTLSTTDDSRRILCEMLVWGRNTLGLTYKDEMIKQWGYISQIVFHTSVPILASMSDPVRKLTEKTSGVIEQLWEGLKYEASDLKIGHDPRLRKNQIASLFIQHRVNSSFSENKYYSEAPLPTHLHIQFIKEFEEDILKAI